MNQHNTSVTPQKWYDSGHASLCVLGKYLRQIGFFEPLEKRVQVQQKVLKYTSVQRLEMFFVGLLAGIKAVSHTSTTVRVDVALTMAFGLPGCAEQSVIADTLDAATPADVADLGEAIADLFERYSPTRHHNARQGGLGAGRGCIAFTREPREQKARTAAIWAAVAPKRDASWCEYGPPPPGKSCGRR